MSTVRQDAWNSDEDLILAEVVLRHIREGSTQLAAFEEVAERLKRTSAACGFRWNSTIRKKYTAAIDLAKKQRKSMNAKDVNKNNEEVELATDYEIPKVLRKEKIESINEVEVEVEDNNELSLQDVINFLQKLQLSNGSSDQIVRENKQLFKENEQLLERNKRLEKEIEQIKKEKEIIQEDYRLLINIMERARKMAVEKESATNE